MSNDAYSPASALFYPLVHLFPYHDRYEPSSHAASYSIILYHYNDTSAIFDTTSIYSSIITLYHLGREENLAARQYLFSLLGTALQERRWDSNWAQ
jgi:hypothetical protein